MKRSLAAVACILLLAVIASAQEATQKVEPKDAKSSEALPDPEQIIEKFIKALGGKEAIEKVTSRVSKGTFEVPTFGGTGTWESYAKAPNKTITIINIPDFGVIRQAFDGKTAWDDNPQMGINDKSGPALTRAKLDAQFYRFLNLKDLYPKMTNAGKKKIGDKDAYEVDATSAEGATESWFFDADTGLLLRVDAEREGMSGMSPTQSFLEDYKEVDGVKIPHSIRQTSADITILLKTTEVKQNVDIDDTKFVKPAAK